MGKNTGLGRGFDSLLPKQFDSSILLEKGEEVRQVPVGLISPNPHQPRKYFEEASLIELADSIKQYGIVQPLVLTPVGQDKYELIAGERRWRSAKIAKLKTVPAIIRSTEEIEKLELGIIENVQRVDLSPLEQASSIAKLHEQFNLSYKQIAQKLNKAPATVNNIVRLLQLPKKAMESLSKNQISEGHARSILSLKERKDEQIKLLELIITKGWSVRQAEKYVTALKSGVEAKRDVAKRVATETPETKVLSRRLGTKVTIQRTAKGGKLHIHFKDEDELKRLLTEVKLNK
jgi:ParB family transcriptional regulator, chromosome partitioning protein